MDYKGYKLIDKIVLVCKEPKDDNEILQAYLADPNNKNQMESAKNWAEWIEYGPYIPNTGYEWRKTHNPIEHTFDNNGFEFSLLDCAGGSSQGGKLSFWNCIVKKDDKTFKIGINSDMLLNVLKEGTFDKGVCKEKVCFVGKNGKCGVVIENGPSYNDAMGDMKLKSDIASSITTKYHPGDRVVTTTIDDTYLGKFYRYYKVEVLSNKGNYSWYKMSDSEKAQSIKIIRLKKPEPVYLFINNNDWYHKENKLTKLSQIKDSNYFWIHFVNKLPRRSVGDNPIEMDMTHEEIGEYFWDANCQLRTYTSSNSEIDKIISTMNSSSFGISDSFRELSEDIKLIIKKYDIKYVEE